MEKFDSGYSRKEKRKTNWEKRRERK